uniref:Uncharacterized protein n=1 Tax=Siphoviridae sp. ctKwY15 TaxID=2827843 RepID=A0A8S5STX9_9CAUD|nr:MAG TPA: hypothetical protein [Siphoviridae sp. ctKwY15]
MRNILNKNFLSGALPCISEGCAFLLPYFKNSFKAFLANFTLSNLPPSIPFSLFTTLRGAFFTFIAVLYVTRFI